MEIKKLTGGRVIGAAPAEDPVPWIKVGTPGILISSVPGAAQFAEAAKAKYGLPQVNLAKVIIRETGDGTYLVVSPYRAEGEEVGSNPQAGIKSKSTKPAGKDVYNVNFAKNAIQITGLKRLFQAVGYKLRPDVWFYMPAILVDDEHVGLSIAGNWTKAEIVPREYGTRGEGKGSSQGSANQTNAGQANPGGASEKGRPA